MFPSRIASVLGGGAGLQNAYSLDFDGTNDYVAIPDSSALDVTGDFTLMAWSKLDAGHESQDGIVSKADGSGNGYGLHYNQDGSDWDIIFFSSKYNVARAVSTAITMGEWNHIVGVHDSTAGSNSLYWNGVLVHSLTSSVANYANNAVDLSIGRAFSDSTAYNHDGPINEVALWNKSLSAGDISALYQARGTSDLNDDGNSANLKGWWRMGDGVLDGYPLIADQVNPTLGSELITNGTFDSDYTGWTGSNAPDLSSVSGGRSGNCLKILEDGYANPGAYDTITTVASTTYKFEFYHKDTDSAGNAPYTYIYDNTGSAVIQNLTLAPETISSSSWVRQVVYFTTPASCISVKVYLIHNALSSSGTASYFDDVSVKQVNGNPGLMTNMTASDIVKDTP